MRPRPLTATVPIRPACTSFSFASASASRPARPYGCRVPGPSAADSLRATMPARTTGEPWLGRPVKLSVSRRISIRIGVPLRDREHDFRALVEGDGNLAVALFSDEIRRLGRLHAKAVQLQPCASSADRYRRPITGLHQLLVR